MMFLRAHHSNTFLLPKISSDENYIRLIIREVKLTILAETSPGLSPSSAVVLGQNTPTVVSRRFSARTFKLGIKSDQNIKGHNILIMQICNLLGGKMELKSVHILDY